MGKGKGGGTEIDPSVQQGLLANQNALVQIAQGAQQNAQSLFNLTEPGLATAENFYQTLAAGDPAAIMRAIAPTAQQASEAATGAKSNIMANAPAGGEKNLALEMTDVNKADVISKAASGASLNAPNALAQLANQGISQSIAEQGTGISGLSAGSAALGSLGGIEAEYAKVQAEQKGAQLATGEKAAETAAMMAMMFL